jgi:hypothetical protein
MAQSAVGAIRAGCQMLSEGKAEIGKFKKQIESGVADAKAIYAEVTGIWGWIKGLLGTPNKPVGSPSPKPTAEPAKPSEKKSKAKRESEQELSFEEFQARAVHDICENLKIYFEAMRQLKAHCRELEQQALVTERVADSAIDRIEMEWQMNQLSAQLKQSMIYGTPESLGLGALYQQFLVTHGEILEEQEVARALKAKKLRDNAWRQEHRNQILIAKATYVVAVAMGFLQLIGMYFTL